ncbi:hypothetical protein, partial [Helicobacter sp. WB40]|uniref:putative barnase/colicin E5 family endoribonuclease n=1 Tax=Helicobacter sp. WB40 TaxID=3004130 RepID=UPI0022EBB850
FLTTENYSAVQILREDGFFKDLKKEILKNDEIVKEFNIYAKKLEKEGDKQDVEVMQITAQDYKEKAQKLREELATYQVLREYKPLAEFGTNYIEFIGDGKGAIEKLLIESKDFLERKEAGLLSRNEIKQGKYKGQVASAFYKKGLGDIDVVWGDSKMGLQHILERRTDEFIKQGFSKEEAEKKAEEFVKEIPQIIEKGEVEKGKNRAFIDTHDNRVLIALDYNGEDRKWIVTAYRFDTAPSPADPHQTKHNISTSSVSRANGDNGNYSTKELKSAQKPQTISINTNETKIKNLESKQAQFKSPKAKEGIQKFIDKVKRKDNVGIDKSPHSDSLPSNEITKSDGTNLHPNDLANYNTSKTKSKNNTTNTKTNLQENKENLKARLENATQKTSLDITTLNESLQKAYKEFKETNKDPYNDVLFDKVLQVANTLGVRYWKQINPTKKAGSYTYFLNRAMIDKKLNIYNPKEIPNVILHELIHSVSSRAIHAYESGSKHLLTKPQIQAIEELKNIYKTITEKHPKKIFKDYSEDMFENATKNKEEGRLYGLYNAQEFLAELSSKDFRNFLKEQNLFSKIINALARIFSYTKEALGLSKQEAKDALEETEDILHKIMDNYNSDFTAKYEEIYNQANILDVENTKALQDFLKENKKEYNQYLKDNIMGKKYLQQKLSMNDLYTHKKIYELNKKWFFERDGIKSQEEYFLKELKEANIPLEAKDTPIGKEFFKIIETPKISYTIASKDNQDLIILEGLAPIIRSQVVYDIDEVTKDIIMSNLEKIAKSENLHYRGRKTNAFFANKWSELFLENLTRGDNAKALENAFLNNDKINENALKAQAVKLPKELKEIEFIRSAKKDNKGYFVDTPIGRVDFKNILKTYRHLYENTYMQDRRELSGAFMETLKNPLFVVRQKYPLNSIALTQAKHSQITPSPSSHKKNTKSLNGEVKTKDIIQDSYVFYKPFVNKNGLVSLASFAISQNGELLHKTFYDIKTLSKLKRLIKGNDEDLLYFKNEKENKGVDLKQSKELEEAFLDSSGRVDLSKFQAQKLPKANFKNIKQFQDLFLNKEGKYGVLKTPYKDIKINIPYAYKHFYKNTNNVNRNFMKGTFFDVLQQPMIIAEKENDIGASVYFYKIYEYQNNKIGIFGIGVNENGEINYKTLYADKKKNRIKEIIKLDENSIKYMDKKLLANANYDTH